MDKWLEVIRNPRIGFCGGLAILAVQVPPNWQAWLSGELSETQTGLWMAALAAITQGVLSKVLGINWKRKEGSGEKTE